MYAKGKVYEAQFLIFSDKIIAIPHEPPPEGSSCRVILSCCYLDDFISYADNIFINTQRVLGLDVFVHLVTCLIADSCNSES